MKTSIPQTLKLMGASVLVAFAFTGCITQSSDDYTPDGGNVIINQESSNMGQVLNTQVSTQVPAKVASGALSDTEIVSHPLALDTCMDTSGTHPCFVREAQFTSSDTTFVRDRFDTLWLLDSNNAYMNVFHPFQASTIKHHRHVVKTKGTESLDIQFNTLLTKGTDSTGAKALIWNGTITGEINGVTINATITNVSRPILGLACGLPEDGSIHIVRGDGVKLDFNFQAAGKAEVVITGRRGKIHHAVINGGVETDTN